MICVWNHVKWVFDFSAYREPYLFVTYFNSLDVIEIQGHAALGWDCAPFVRTSASVCTKNIMTMINTLFESCSPLFLDLTHTHTWISQIRATLAQPSLLGPSTWPRRTRTNCGSFAARATWSRARRVLETCSVTVQDAGEDTHSGCLLTVLELTLPSSNSVMCIFAKIISFCHYLVVFLIHHTLPFFLLFLNSKHTFFYKSNSINIIPLTSIHYSW